MRSAPCWRILGLYPGRNDMNDLFGNQSEGMEHIPLVDADVRFLPGFLTPDEAIRAFESLRTSVAWRDEEIVIWGKRHMQPRRVAWFGDPGTSYSYSGSKLDAMPWTPMLSELRGRIELLSQTHFNSVLLNLYRNESDRMGWHSDNEPELGPRPIIASLSLGARRVFQMKHKHRKELGTHSFELPPGSLLLMAGTTQRFWLHSIRKESRPTDPRINLTFRRIFSPREGKNEVL